MNDIIFMFAVACFLSATAIDFPLPESPTRRMKDWGNFICCLGWTLLVLGIWGK